MTLEPGRILAHYRLVEKIGEGGMGVVWRAADTVLERQVAIKVLPPGVAHNPERLARFEREAKILASLNHPGIAAIYGLDREQEVRFLVLELVPGETLAERLARGRLPARDALAMGRSVAEAVEAAHESGVLHRDLKPANIKITEDGRVKVLDFGLAKSFAADGGSRGHSELPTRTSVGTDQGMILGTIAYMSPEQARGRALDKRTDVWSFGCLLYEALVGRRPFVGETPSDILARILERDPDWEVLESRVPSRAAGLVRRCLRKDPVRRLRDIGDARIEIDEILQERPEDTPATTAAARRSGRGALVAAAAAGILAGGILAWMWLRGAPVPDAGRLVVEVARLTHDPGLSEWPTWSRDGSLLAFASDRDGDFDIFVRRVDGGHEVNVTEDDAQDYQPAFSPDGGTIAFISTRSSRTGMIKIGSTFGMEFRTLGGDLWVTPALGGRPRRLAPDANYPAWHPDGSRVAYVSGPENHRTILTISAEGGASRPVLTQDKSTWEIVRVQYSPSGKWLSFESLLGSVYLMPAEGGEARELMVASNHVWDAGGGMYFLTRDRFGGTRLQHVAVDEDSGDLRGAPRSLGLMTGTLRDLAVAADGKRLAVSELEGALNLTLLPLDAQGSAPAGPERILSSGQVIDRYPSFSPDGRKLVFSSDRLGPMEIWILDLETGSQERLHLPGEDLGASFAYFSPDGGRLVMVRFEEGGLQSLWLAAVDGSQAEELVPGQPGLLGGGFSPDGRSVLYAANVGDYKQIFALDLQTRESRQITASEWDTFEAFWSPTGGDLGVISNQSGSVQVWRLPADGGPTRPLTTGDERVRHMAFSPDGRWIYFQPSHRNIYRVPADGGTPEAVTRFPESGLFIEEPALSPDGRHLAYCRSNGGSSLWLLTVGNAAAPVP